MNPKKLVALIINCGARGDMSSALVKRIKISNLFAFVFAFIVFLYGGLFWALDLKFMALMTIPFSLAFLSVLGLNYAALYNLSRVAIMVIANAIVYSYAASFGAASEIHYWFIVVMILPFILFDLKDRAFLISTSTATLMVFTFLKITRHQYSIFPKVHIEASYLPIIAITMVSVALLFTLLIVYLISNSYEQTLQALEKETEREQKARWQTISLEKAITDSAIVSRADKKGRITYVNDEICKISGYSSEELLGQDHRILNSGYHTTEFFAEMWQTITHGELWRGEICNRKKDGSFYWVDSAIMALSGVNGEIQEYISIRYDVTAQKMKEQKMLQSAKMAALGEMAAGIAHEINNPLAIVRGKSLQMYRDLKNGDFNKEEFLLEFEKIEKTTMRITNIIKSLRTFSRNGQRDPLLRHNLLQIINDTLELCKNRFKDHGIELRVECTPNTSVECRPAQISQIILNLLNNAYDAVDILPNKWIELAVQTKETTVEISIKDSGKGISPEVVKKLMQPFFTTKEVGKGTGLGLSISKGLAADNLGTLRYDSDSANTRFILELPLSSLV